MTSDSRKVLWKRLGVAGLAGVLVAGVCFNYGRRPVSRDLRMQLRISQKAVQATDEAIKVYRREKGGLPVSLASLAELSDLPYGVMMEQNGTILDAFRQPLSYRVRGDGYTLLSLGKDGRPGGVGLDEDITVDHFPHGGAELPALQIISYSLGQQVLGVSLLFGVLTFSLVFFTVPAKDFQRGETEVLAVRLCFTLAMTLLATFFIGCIIMFLLMPSGH